MWGGGWMQFPRIGVHVHSFAWQFGRVSGEVRGEENGDHTIGVAGGRADAPRPAYMYSQAKIT